MRSLIICLFCFATIFTNAQTPVLTPQHMQSDLDYLQKYLRKWHPTFNAYTPKTEMDSFYQNLKDSCVKDLSQREFFLNVRKAVAKVGCGHMGIYMATKNDTNKREVKFLPLQVWVLDSQMFVKAVNRVDSALKIGDEILAVNGEKTPVFIQKAKDILVTDGYNQGYKLAQLESSVEVLLYYLYGETPNYSLTIKNTVTQSVMAQNALKGGISTVNMAATAQKDVPNTSYAMRYDSSKLVIKGRSVGLYKTDFDAQTMILDINNFNGKKQYKTFRKAFKYLKDNKIQNLVIDLRNNGGGSIFKGNKLLTYLLDQPVIPFIISRKPNLTPINPRFKGGFWNRITPVLFMTIPLQFPSKHGWNHMFPFFKKTRNHFDGKVYVLTNRGSFSMASYVASYLKHKRQAIIIGEETGGSEYASRSSSGGVIRLPNSKVNVQLNVYQTRHYVGIEDKGQGVLPDFSTHYTIEDKMNNVDLDIQQVKKLINKQ